MVAPEVEVYEVDHLIPTDPPFWKITEGTVFRVAFDRARREVLIPVARVSAEGRVLDLTAN